MQIQIIWEKDRPYFISDDKKGDCILLNFGLEYVDDIEVTSERFFVFMQNAGSRWQALIDNQMSHGIIHRDLVRELTTKINSTLETKDGSDMVEYVMSNKEAYAFLSHQVCWIDKYRPIPPGISRLIR